MTIGERIKTVRQSKKLTLDRFGDRIGFKKSALSQIENGKVNVTDRVIKSICREFNVNEHWLITGEGGEEMLCRVKILGSPSGRAEIYIDGRKLDGVIGFKLEQNAYEKRVPELTLRVMCEAEIDSGVVCPLPEPWSMFYEPKSGEELKYP